MLNLQDTPIRLRFEIVDNLGPRNGLEAVFNSYRGTVEIYNEDFESVEKLGQIEVLAYHSQVVDDMRQSAYEAFDCHSSATLRIFEALFDPDGTLNEKMQDKFPEIDFFDPGMLIIDHLEIVKKYRGSGLGALAVLKAVDLLGFGCSFAVVLPGVITKGPNSSYAEKKKRIVRFYRRLGFRSVNHEVMVMPIIDGMTSRLKAKEKSLMARTNRVRRDPKEQRNSAS